MHIHINRKKLKWTQLHNEADALYQWGIQDLGKLGVCLVSVVSVQQLLAKNKWGEIL